MLPAGHQPTRARPALKPAAAPSVAVRSGQPAPAGSPRAATIDSRAISTKLAADVAGLQGQYGIDVIDLASGSAYGVNAQQSFRAASVNKLPILISLYERAQSGRLNLSQTITLTDADIQHYGTGTIQNPGSPRTYTLADLAALMVKVSDNTAAYVLERFLGQANVQSDIQRWGFTHTSMAGNATTPADAASLAAALYNGRLLSPSGSQAVLNLLQQTAFDDRLAAGLPADVPVAHKIGTDTGIFNDVGIVLLHGRPYAVAVLSEDANEAEADRAYARINTDLLAFERSLPPLSTR
jgi:beta-lactamase class A